MHCILNIVRRSKNKKGKNKSDTEESNTEKSDTEESDNELKKKRAYNSKTNEEKKSKSENLSFASTDILKSKMISEEEKVKMNSSVFFNQFRKNQQKQNVVLPSQFLTIGDNYRVN